MRKYVKKIESSLDVIKKISLQGVGFHKSVGQHALYKFEFFPSSDYAEYMEVAHPISYNNKQEERQVLEFWESVCEYFQALQKSKAQSSQEVLPWLESILSGEELTLNLHKNKEHIRLLIIVALPMLLGIGVLSAQSLKKNAAWPLALFFLLIVFCLLTTVLASLKKAFSSPPRLKINATKVSYYKKDILMVEIPISEIVRVLVPNQPYGCLIINSNTSSMNIGNQIEKLKDQENQKIKKLLFAMRRKAYDSQSGQK